MEKVGYRVIKDRGLHFPFYPQKDDGNKWIYLDNEGEELTHKMTMESARFRTLKEAQEFIKEISS